MTEQLPIEPIPPDLSTPKIAHYLYVFDGAFDGMPGRIAVAGFPSMPKAGTIPDGDYAGYEHTTQKGTYMVYIHSNLAQRGLTARALKEAASVVAFDLEGQSPVIPATTGKPKKRLRRR